MAQFALPDVLAEIDKQAPIFGVDPLTAKAIAIAENTANGSMSGRKSYSGDAVSPAGASGVMQVMPATATGLQKAGFLPPEWSHDPENLSSQVQAGLAALKEKTARMKNPSDLGEVASVFNGSSKTHRAYKEGNFEAIPAETKQYADKLRRAAMELGMPATAPSTPAVASTPVTSTPGSASRQRTTRSTVNDPGMMDAFMTDIMGATGAGGVFDQASEQVKEQGQVRELLSGELINAVAAKGAAAGAEAIATTTQQAANDARRAQILRNLNLDPTATSNEMMRAFDKVNEADTQLQAMKPEIDQRMAVGILDNPIEWLINQTRLPGMVSQYNSIVGTQKDAVSRFKTLSDIANTQQTISASTDADLLMRKGEATASKIAADAAADVARIKMETAGATTRDSLVLAQLLGQKINLEAAGMAQTKQTISETAGESERQKAQRAEEETLAGVNRILVAAGGNPISSLKQLPPAKVEVLKSAATAGTFGKDFAESFQLIYNDGNRAKMAAGGDATVVYWINGTAGEASKKVGEAQKLAEASRTKFDPKKALPDELNTMQRLYEQEAATDMRKASKYNPFKLDYVTIAKAPELAKNSLAIWLNTYGPQGTEPMLATVDEQRIMDKFTQSVSSGTMSAAQAANEISKFYQVGNQKQSLTSKWALFGLAKPEKTYVVKIKEGVGSPTSVDLGNPTQVENALTKKVAYSLAIKNTLGWSSFPATKIFNSGETQ